MQRNVLEYLEQSALNYPEKTAFADTEESVTYRELWTRAKRIAAGLQKAIGAQVRKPVVVLVDKDIQSIISFFGVAYTGNFYVPIDKDLPRERIESMVSLLEPAGIIYHDATGACAKEIETDVLKFDYK